MSIQKIKASEAAAYGVSSLPNRPSSPSLYSGNALTAEELRAAFDRLPLLVAERLNDLIEATGLYTEGEERDSLAALIATGLADGHSLEDLFRELESGELAHRISADGARSLYDALAALEATVSLPDGVSDLRTYVDTPKGRVEAGDPLPVSGDSVFRHLKETENTLRAEIPLVEGEVKQNEHLAVTGDKVFRALRSAVDPIDARLSAVEEAAEGMPFRFETVRHTEAEPIVPEGAATYARLDSVEGITKKCPGLLRLTPNTLLGEITNGGVTTVFSVDEEGYLTIDSGGEDNGISSFIPIRDIFVAFPPHVTLSARYVSGTVTDGAAGRALLVGSLNLSEGELPTETSPFFTKTAKNVSYETELYFHAVGCFTQYKIALQLEEGTLATPFCPYFAELRSAKVTEVKSYGRDGTLLDSLIIPEEIRALSGYGLGIDGVCANTLHLGKRKFVKNTEEALCSDMNANNSFYFYEYSNQNQIYQISSKSFRLGQSTSLCDVFTNTGVLSETVTPVNGTLGWIYGDHSTAYGKYFKPPLDLFPTLSEFSAWFRQQSGGRLVYALGDNYVTETDVSPYLPISPYLKVESGGRLEAVNEYGYVVPFTMTYQINNR